MTQATPWATCGGCRYWTHFDFYGDGKGDTGRCHVGPRIRERERGDIACRHYEPRYTPPPKDEEASRG